MPKNLNDLKTKLDRLPREKEIRVVYKVDTLEQIMKLLGKELKLLK